MMKIIIYQKYQLERPFKNYYKIKDIGNKHYKFISHLHVNFTSMSVQILG